MPRPKQRTPALRAAILEAALASLADRGPTGLTARGVASAASTSVAAVYELYGDKRGLVRALFFEGFRRLAAAFERLEDSDDPEADLLGAVWAFRRFAQAHPALVQVMFERPFAEFDPGPDDAAAGAATRRFVVGRVERCVAAGMLVGDPTDVAHGLLALAQGLAAQEAGGWLGSTPTSIDRRWEVNVAALVAGHRPAPPSG